jgi:hypothetical protein
METPRSSLHPQEGLDPESYSSDVVRDPDGTIRRIAPDPEREISPPPSEDPLERPDDAPQTHGDDDVDAAPDEDAYAEEPAPVSGIGLHDLAPGEGLG